jgi:hypothetical protein
MAELRLRAYELRVEGGDRLTRALLACGWTDARPSRRPVVDDPGLS